MAKPSHPPNVGNNPSEPLLLTSRQAPSSFENPNLIDRHLQVVDRVIDALSQGNQMEENMDDQDSDDSGSLLEHNNDMVLCQDHK